MNTHAARYYFEQFPAKFKHSDIYLDIDIKVFLKTYKQGQIRNRWFFPRSFTCDEELSLFQ